MATGAVDDLRAWPVARPGDALRAGAVCRHWHELLRHDHIWEPLCRATKVIGLATGWDMLAKVKARPECRLSWKQLFLQRARCLRPDAEFCTALLERREDFLIGVEVHMLGSRERVLLDANDDELVVRTMREVMVRERTVKARESKARRVAQAFEVKGVSPYLYGCRVLSSDSALLVYLQDKTALIRLARSHVVELFGRRAMVRDEWVVLQAIRLAEELLPKEALLQLKPPPSGSGRELFLQEQRSRWKLWRKQRESRDHDCRPPRLVLRMHAACKQSG